ncbi:MAG: NHLP family bacteriocin export ABC transporter peptidase/permease/ATPase subunit [Proteobacteria bacterium]|nr:NHLP family bacteriocin export ABC transporter peptidase/permease/ATPase subunit [Pseudomonadota bacterium]
MINKETSILWHRKRVKTPTLIQMEALECGAAALGIVLGYYGLFVPLEKLRQDCGVSRDGSKALNMIKAARDYGMEAKGFRKEPQGLKTLALPLILFWNFNHFVVLEGIKGRQVFINDPASGPKILTYDELDQAFTGVVLSIVPGPKFKKGGKKAGVFRALKHRIPRVKTGLSFAVLAGLALVVPGLIIPTFSRVFVDEILVGRNTQWFKPMLLGMGLTLLLQGGLVWVQQQVLLRQQVNLAIQTSARFFRHVMQLPYAFFAQRYAGEISTRVAINDRVAQLLSGELANTAISLVSLVFFAALMAGYNVRLTLIGVCMAGVNFIVLKQVSKKRADLSQQVVQERGKLMGTAMNGISLIETIKATGSETDFFSRWAGYQAKAMGALQNLLKYSYFLSALPILMSSLAMAAILGVGAMEVMAGNMTMGMLVAFQSLMGSFMSPVEQMVNLGGRFQEALGDMNRLDDVLSYETDPVYDIDSRSITFKDRQVQLSGRLSLSDISFGYNRLDTPLIRGFDLSITPGSRVALVGASGSGKSTIAKMVCGLSLPWQGEVRFDDLPRQKIPRLVLLNSLSYVDQHIFLIQGSIRENLTMWNPAVPDADMIRAAKDACIHKDIAARSQGYESHVEEGGKNFSGGQRQRLEIARALTSNPSVLVLDEATSALDPETEKKIDENLRKRGCTCLIIAHRLSTIRDCDEIIVLDKGTVVQRGLHQDLIREEGLYARLIES